MLIPNGATGKDPSTMKSAFSEEELPVIGISGDASRHRLAAAGAVDRREGHPPALKARAARG